MKRIAGILLVAVVLLFLSSNVLAGPIRYFLDLHNLRTIIYIPQIFGVIACLAYLCRPRISKLLLFLILLSIFACLNGLYHSGGTHQVLFGLYVLMPLFLGIISYSSITNYLDQIRIFFLILLTIAVLGVFLDVPFDMPWLSSRYIIGEYEIDIARGWTTIGIERRAGFSRASFDAAIQIFLLATFLQFFIKRRLLRSVIWIISGFAIALTTTKGIIIAYCWASFFLNFYRLLPRWFWKALTVLIISIGIALPWASFFIPRNLRIIDPVGRFLLSSLLDRIYNNWPEALHLIIEHGNAIFGRGIGGIGVAQMYFESGLYNPADNIHIYLYALIGIAYIVIIMYLVYVITRLRYKALPFDRLAFVIIVAAFIFGITSNVLEAAFFSYFIGITTRYIVARSNHDFVRMKVLSPP